MKLRKLSPAEMVQEVQAKAQWTPEMEKDFQEDLAWYEQLPEAQRKRLGGIETITASPKVGRNDLCPCGSSKKFKRCCGK